MYNNQFFRNFRFSAQKTLNELFLNIVPIMREELPIRPRFIPNIFLRRMPADYQHEVQSPCQRNQIVCDLRPDIFFDLDFRILTPGIRPGAQQNIQTDDIV